MKIIAKRLLLIGGGFVVLFAVSWFDLFVQTKYQMIGGGINGVFLFLLINAHVLLMGVLLYLITRHLIKLFMERRKGAPGSVFKRNLVFAFILFSVLPALFVFFMAGSFIVKSIDRWFQVRFDTLFANTSTLHLHHTERLRQRLQDQGLLLDRLLTKGVDVMPALHRLRDAGVQSYVVTAFDGSWLNNEGAVWRTFRVRNDRSIKSLKKRFLQLVERHQEGGCFDFFGSLYWSKLRGNTLTVLAYRYPPHVRYALIGLENSIDDYKQLCHLRGEVRLAYLWTFVLLALLILFLALWCALYLARGLSTPITELLEATERLRCGDWSVRVSVTPSNDLHSLAQAFNHMAQELQQMKARLEQEQKLKTWQEAAKQMAHEIKNPLTPIQLATQRLQRKFEHQVGKDPAFRDCTNIILDHVATIKNLVAHFVQFASLPEVAKTSCDVVALARDLFGLYQLSYPDIRFNLSSDQQERLLWTDKEKVKLILVNLLDNSVRALGTLEQTLKRVDMCIVVEGDLLVITCEDNGPGIAQNVQDTLFLPYVSTEKKNMGLGLAIVYQMATQLGGTITLLPTKTGALFRLSLMFITPSDQKV